MGLCRQELQEERTLSPSLGAFSRKRVSPRQVIVKDLQERDFFRRFFVSHLGLVSHLLKPLFHGLKVGQNQFVRTISMSRRGRRT